MALLVNSVPLSLTIVLAGRESRLEDHVHERPAGRTARYPPRHPDIRGCSNCQDAKTPATGQLIGDEVKRPVVIGPQREGDRRPHSHGPFATATLPQCPGSAPVRQNQRVEERTIFRLIVTIKEWR
jgi:hypothetical protein